MAAGAGRHNGRRLHPTSRLILAALFIIQWNAVQAQSAGNLVLDFSIYTHHVGIDEDYDFTLNSGADLPAAFSYSGFANIRNVLHSGKVDLQNSEQNLRWRVADGWPIDLNAQAIFLDGPGNDSLQLGPRWRLNDTPLLKKIFDAVHTTYSVTFFVTRFDSDPDEVKQISHAYGMRFPYFSDRLYLSGFVDHNFHKRPENGRKRGLITETQIGVRLYSQLYAIGEYRLNQYRKENRSNLSFGFEVKTRW